MRYALAFVLALGAVPAHAMMNNCPLCALGEILNGAQQQQPQYVPPPQPFYQPPQVQFYNLPNGMNGTCMTYTLGGRPFLDCN